jgi:hypothetical protein
MSCDRFPLIRMRVRVARAAASAGQCSLARRWLNRACRDLRAVTTMVAAKNSCQRVVAGNTSDALVAATARAARTLWTVYARVACRRPGSGREGRTARRHTRLARSRYTLTGSRRPRS